MSILTTSALFPQAQTINVSQENTISKIEHQSLENPSDTDYCPDNVIQLFSLLLRIDKRNKKDESSDIQTTT